MQREKIIHDGIPTIIVDYWDRVYGLDRVQAWGLKSYYFDGNGFTLVLDQYFLGENNDLKYYFQEAWYSEEEMISIVKLLLFS